jgi:hypothetical protein
MKGASSCKLALTVDKTTSGNFANGIGTIKLAAPGTGSSGLVNMWLGTANGLAGAPVWLPSGRGVLTYGTVQTRPFTYLRELY